MQNSYVDTQTVAEERGPSSFSIKILPWLVCGLGAIFYLYEYFLRISPSVMSQGIVGDFHISAEAFGNLSAFYYYIYTPMQLPVGILMDRYGPRRLLTLACIACAVGAYAFAATNSIHVAEFGRFLIGFGSAFAFVGVLKLASIWLPANRFALIAGLATTLGMIGAMIGDVALAKLVNHIGWRHTSFISAYIGLGLALVFWFVIKDKNKHATKTKSAPTTINYNKALKGLIEFLKMPQMWVVGIIGGLLYLPLSAFAELWGVPFLHQAYGFSQVDAAAAASMVFFGWAVGGPIIGALSDHLNNRRLPIAIGSILAAIAISIVIYVPGLPRTVVFAVLFAFGACASAQPIVFAIARDYTSAKLAGTAIAVTNMLVMLGGVIFQPAIGALLDERWKGVSVAGVPQYSMTDYRYALSVLPICLLLTVVLTFFVKSSKKV